MVYLAYSKPNKCTRAEMSAEGRRLLGVLLECVGENPDPELSKDENGRPYIIGKKDLDFNISHSDILAVCALSVGDGRVGVDTESKISAIPPERQKRFAERYFSEREKEIFFSDPTSFLRIWTAKEAYLKHKGVGIATKLSEAATESLPSNLKLVLFDTDDHFITLCVESDAEIKVIKNR